MGKKKAKMVEAVPDVDGMDDENLEDDARSIEDGKLSDYITGKQLKETATEKVRQRIARAIFHEYGFSPDDMEPDFRVNLGNKRKSVDIAIFKRGSEHIVENLHRIVICKPEPKQGKKGAYKLRDHEQATKDLDELKDLMENAESCQWGLWTNGLELFFIKKEQGRFEAEFRPSGDWPLADESQGTKDVHSHAKLRKADPELLRITFRRCHNFIHGNEGMQKDAAFWQFLYLIFAKMYDERQSNGDRRFWVAPNERFEKAGQQAIRKRIIPLFHATRDEYSGEKYGRIFQGNEEIALSDRALAFMVSELAKYDFSRTDTDAKGAAYQEIVRSNLRGDLGQFFTPRNAIKLMVQMLAPKEGERIIDPSCGTGGFLIATLAYLNKAFHDEAGVDQAKESTEEFVSYQKRLKQFAKINLFAADFDPALVRASQMNVVMACNQMANIFHMNSLEFPNGHLDGVPYMNKRGKLGTMDVVMTNPPFGADIPVTEPHILKDYELAHEWERTETGTYRNTGRIHGSVAPQILFIERCLKWLRPGGRMGIVLPDGILSNAGDEYIRDWIIRNSYVLASVSLPIETFVVDANVNILTSLLFLRKKTEEEIAKHDLKPDTNYDVFMAIAESVGYDRKGNTLYRRTADGEEVVRELVVEERVRLNGEWITRILRRQEREVDDDLPLIADAYEQFRRKSKTWKGN